MKATFVAAFALFAGYNVYSSQKSDVMSDLALANVEALASGEVIKVCPKKGGTCTVQIGEQTVVGSVGWQK